jgi:hypothetical protein
MKKLKKRLPVFEKDIPCEVCDEVGSYDVEGRYICQKCWLCFSPIPLKTKEEIHGSTNKGT